MEPHNRQKYIAKEKGPGADPALGRGWSCGKTNGFTLIELMVVISIMALLASSIIADYAAQRIPRSLLISQNELVTHLREMQSYTLSSWTDNGRPVQYYLAQFDLNNPASYQLQSITLADTLAPQVHTVQTVRLPSNIKLKAVTINGVAISSGCALVAFRLPYAKVIMRDGCSLPAAPTVTAGDNYSDIISFVNNGAAVSDQPMVITVSDDADTRRKSVSVSGVTGLINFQ